jgi:hypothetical protein
MLRAEPERPPQVKPDRKPPVKRAAKRVSKQACGETERVAKVKLVAKIQRVAKYIHSTDKWIALRTKMREATLREKGLVRVKLAQFFHKALPTYTAEHQSKYLVEQDSDNPVEVPVVVTPKRECRDDDCEDAETNHLRELGKLRFRDKQYGIRKEGTTLMIGNSAVDLDTPVLSRLKGNRSSLKGIVGSFNT